MEAVAQYVDGFGSELQDGLTNGLTLGFYFGREFGAAGRVT